EPQPFWLVTAAGFRDVLETKAIGCFSHGPGRPGADAGPGRRPPPLAPGGGPEGIAAAPDGSVWFAQSLAGNIARITSTRVVTEGKRVKGSEPFGVTVAPNGDPWYAELSADKIAVVQLR